MTATALKKIALTLLLATGLAGCQTMSTERKALESSKFPSPPWQYAKTGVGGTTNFYICRGSAQCGGSNLVVMSSGMKNFNANRSVTAEDVLRSTLFDTVYRRSYAHSTTGKKVLSSRRLGGVYPGYYSESREVLSNGSALYYVARVRAKGNTAAVVAAGSDNLNTSRKNANRFDPALLLQQREPRY